MRLINKQSWFTKLKTLVLVTDKHIFNVRETLLDLYLLYLEVTRRRGYHQVGEEKKWGEVVSALKLEGSNAKLSTQVEKLYAHILYQFEKLYFYKCPAKQAATGSTKGALKRKLNSPTSLSPLMDNEDDQTVTKISEDCSSQMTGAGYAEQPGLPPAPSNDKEKKKRRGAPPGQRNAYHIFLKQEFARLKTCGQDFVRPRILRLVVDAWRKMSEIEKQQSLSEIADHDPNLLAAVTPAEAFLFYGLDFHLLFYLQTILNLCISIGSSRTQRERQEKTISNSRMQKIVHGSGIVHSVHML